MKKIRHFFHNHIKEFHKIGQKQKITVVILLAGSFLFGIGIPYMMKITYNPAVTPSPTVIPTPPSILIPASVKLTASQSDIDVEATFSAVISMDSPNQGVEAADFVLRFDPSYLKAASISEGNYFGVYPVKKIEKDSVRISGIANLVDNKFIIPKGSGTVATIIFEAVETTPSARISFDPVKTVIASEGRNILENISNLTVNIK